VAVGLLASPNVSRADALILPGFDVFRSTERTEFMGVPFVGVPLGAFDFGGGPIGVGDASTIVHRPIPASGDPAMIPIELVALQLVSQMPVDFGAGLDFHYITLQGIRGGPPSGGRLTITGLSTEMDPHGTFDSSLDVFFDLRKGSLTGPILLSDQVSLAARNEAWSHRPPPQAGAALFPGVNYLLNGHDQNNDFWPLGRGPNGEFCEENPFIPAHDCIEPAHPEPSSIVLLGLGAAGLVGYRWRRRRQAA
jgi:hypothetical protein